MPSFLRDCPTYTSQERLGYDVVTNSPQCRMSLSSSKGLLLTHTSCLTWLGVETGDGEEGGLYSMWFVTQGLN